MDGMEYHPDRWQLLEINDDGRTKYKLLASFIGGYLTGDMRYSPGARTRASSGTHRSRQAHAERLGREL